MASVGGGSTTVPPGATWYELGFSSFELGDPRYHDGNDVVIPDPGWYQCEVWTRWTNVAASFGYTQLESNFAGVNDQYRSTLKPGFGTATNITQVLQRVRNFTTPGAVMRGTWRIPTSSTAHAFNNANTYCLVRRLD